MAASTDVTLTGSWQAIATAGEVVFTANQPILWRVTNSTTAPTSAQGHMAPAYVDEAMTLTGTERLWVRGSGSITVTADAPV